MIVNEKIDADSYVIPINVYYKYGLNDKFKFYGGLGISVVYTNYKIEHKSFEMYYSDYESSSGKKDNSFSKIAPNFVLGAEYAFSSRFSLTLDLNYLAGAKAENKDLNFRDGENLYRDLSGINVNLSAKVYLF